MRGISCFIFSVITVSMAPFSSSNWFWHFGGALNLNTIANAMDIIDNINLVFGVDYVIVKLLVLGFVIATFKVKVN